MSEHSNELRKSAAATDAVISDDETSSGIGKENSIYLHRFNNSEEELRSSTWKILVPSFLQKYVASDSIVVDLGAGDGHFIRHIDAKRKIAVDLSSHVKKLEKEGIEVIQCEATQLKSRLDTAVDVVFMSNFLEHLPTKRVLLEVLDACRTVLRPGGKIIILQPNIRYVGSAYWDYVDHHIALTEHSLTEALEVSGYEIEHLIPKFLPYTAKSSVGRFTEFLTAIGIEPTTLVTLYLKYPILWNIFGKQTFVVAKKALN